MAECDVCVVGAGPSGSTAAKCLQEKGMHCIIVEKQRIPRKKTCAGWLNGRVFEYFPYLKEVKGRFVEKPFRSLIFSSSDLAKKTVYKEDADIGYSVKRDVFDTLLVKLATDAGAELKDGCALTELGLTDEWARVLLSDGTEITAKMVMGADGIKSSVARLSGINPGWPTDKVILCLNKDVPVDERELDKFYGEERPMHICFAYSYISGYAWIFPKRDEIAVGIGGRASSTMGLGQTFERFVADAVKSGILPGGLDVTHPDGALIPAGAGVDARRAASGRVILLGDAAGFASGSTGEGIFPGMRSALVAAAVAGDAIRSENFDDAAANYDKAWRSELESYIKTPATSELMLLTMLYSFDKVRDKIARKFLYGA